MSNEDQFPTAMRMTLEEYQRRALKSAIYPYVEVAVTSRDGFMDRETAMGVLYPVLKLAGEAGEVAEKLGKIIRDKGGEISADDNHALRKELGDVLWYVTACANELGCDLEDIARVNLEKLESRVARGVLQGSGDDR
jgi:NTP pyrophosphatase (non-canonical NTP hydrolase)